MPEEKQDMIAGFELTAEGSSSSQVGSGDVKSVKSPKQVQLQVTDEPAGSGKDITPSTKTPSSSSSHEYLKVRTFSSRSLGVSLAKGTSFVDIATAKPEASTPGSRPDLAQMLDLTFSRSVTSSALEHSNSKSMKSLQNLDEPDEKTNTGCCAKLLCGVGHGFVVTSMLCGGVHGPKIYITNFGAQPVVFSIVLFLSQIYDAVNVVPVARWSDAGKLNGACFPIDGWGRRAPFALLGLPLLGLGAFLGWVGAAGLGAVAAALWFGLAKFLIATGSTFFYMASTSSMFELFPLKGERVTVTSLMSAFVMLGVIIALVVFSKIAFSVAPGSDAQNKTFFLLGVISCSVIIFAIPHVCIMRRTQIKETAGSPTLCYCIKTAWGNQSMKYLVTSYWLYNGVVNICISLMPFYLQYGCGIPADELGNPLAAVMGSHVMGRILLLAPGAWLTRRFHPASAIASSMVFCVSVCTPIFIISITSDSWWMLCIVGVVLALNFGIADVGFKVLLGWVIDEDQVVRTEIGIENGNPEYLAPRRDGIFWCVHTFFQVLGQLFLSLGLGLFGVFSMESFEQPRTQTMAIIGYFFSVTILNQFIVAAVLFKFPLKGQRLEDIDKKYQVNFEKMQKRL